VPVSAAWVTDTDSVMASPVMTVALPRESGETGKSFGARLRLFMYDTKRPLLSGKESTVARMDMQVAKRPGFRELE
jgi:hypothetical protein